MPISLPPPKCILCMKPITERPFAYWGRHWAAVAHPRCVEQKLHNVRPPEAQKPEQSDGCGEEP